MIRRDVSMLDVYRAIMQTVRNSYADAAADPALAVTFRDDSSGHIALRIAYHIKPLEGGDEADEADEPDEAAAGGDDVRGRARTC